MIRQRRNAGICWDEKEKATQVKQTMQREEINQKVMAKEERLKRYRDWIKQYRKNNAFQNNERKLYQQVGGECTKTSTPKLAEMKEKN